LIITAIGLASGGAVLAQTQSEPKFVITPVVEKTLAQLPAGALFWQVESFPALAQAKAAEGTNSMAAEVDGKAWLFTLGPKGSATAGGKKVAEIGPVPRVQAPEYKLAVTHSGGPPRAKTPVHSHPGAEAFYVISGRLGQKTPHGVSYAEAGQTMNGHEADMPMEVFSAGDIDLDQLVLFVLDATRPFAAPAKLD
jgi:hypothetical protein